MIDNILVVGLGSMGKRRIRCLQKLGVRNIIGVDTRLDRCLETKKLYSIDVQQDIDQVLIKHSFQAAIVSAPPDIHHGIMRKMIGHDIPHFVEASVILADLQEIDVLAQSKNILIAPSSTLRFHPAISIIRNLIISGEAGKVSNLTLHSGQYLPDWHPYEDVADYYVSKKETGGAREILPFELTWITEIFGHPVTALGIHQKTIDIIGAEEICDNYHCILKYPSSVMNLVVDVVSRPALRRLLINASNLQIHWEWENNFVKTINFENNQEQILNFQTSKSASGYNENIPESMYVSEVEAFLKAVQGTQKFPNKLEDDIRILKLLLQIEQNSEGYRV
jgi:predicted dehydrogenase